VLGIALLVCAACASLPKTHTCSPSSALADTADSTSLGRVAARRMSELNGPSGIKLMPRGPDAFLARLTLVDLAERSLDLQYYSWHDDSVGKLLVGAVMRAADRGVRVRLLIDDVGVSPDDRTLLLLDAHPNIEVRLFNPISSRSVKALWMISDFSRVNRRMHNKSITADNQMTIVGGRNIGDEYFEASTVMNYADLDALAIGAAVAAVSARFDRYWNSPIVYGITELRHESPASGDLERAAAVLRAFEQQQRDARYAQAMRESRLSQELRDGRVSFSPARIEVTSDDPIKVEHPGKDRSQNLMPQLRPQFDGARESVMLVSPYFVPRKGGVEFLRSLRARGVRVRVLTNGLASTDVLPVFGKYKKYRRQLLEAGVELYEIDPAYDLDGPAGPLQTSDGANATDAKAPRAALHGKVLSFDCLQFFVGSMNLDPRSAFTNTEIGFLVDAPDVAGPVCEALDETFARAAFRLELTTTSNGARHLEWVDTDKAGEQRFTSEPRASRWQRFKAWMYGILPIESLM
jgi:putative cardiolipin synthase